VSKARRWMSRRPKHGCNNADIVNMVSASPPASEVKCWLEQVEGHLGGVYTSMFEKFIPTEISSESSFWSDTEETEDDRSSSYACVTRDPTRRGRQPDGAVTSIGLWLEPSTFESQSERWRRSGPVLLEVAICFYDRRYSARDVAASLSYARPDMYAGLDEGALCRYRYEAGGPRLRTTNPLVGETVDESIGSPTSRWISVGVEVGSDLEDVVRRSAEDAANSLRSPVERLVEAAHYLKGLLSPGKGSVENNILGFCGEYVVHRRYPELSWVGPAMAPFDFVGPKRSIEVKASSGEPPSSAQFTNREIRTACVEPGYEVATVGVDAGACERLQRLVRRRKRSKSMPSFVEYPKWQWALYQMTGSDTRDAEESWQREIEAALNAVAEKSTIKWVSNPFVDPALQGVQALVTASDLVERIQVHF